MSFTMSSGPTFTLPRKTIAFGTRIQSLIPGRGDTRGSGYRAKVLAFAYTDAGTAHTLTFLRPLKIPGGGRIVAASPQRQITSHSYVTAAVAASASTFAIDRDPGAYAANAIADGAPVPSVADNLIAASDFYAVKLPGGNWFNDTVSARTVNADGTVTITPTGTIPAGGFSAQAVFYFFGVAADLDPRSGVAHPAFAGGAGSAKTTFDGLGGSLAQGHGPGEPILFDSNNATATGILEYCNGVYAKF